MDQCFHMSSHLVCRRRQRRSLSVNTNSAICQWSHAEFKAGTHEATNLCNTSQQQISSCEQENFVQNFAAAT